MPNILLIHYFGGGGGKFIANCLTLSGQVAFPNYETALAYQHDKNIENLEQALLNTIPSRTHSKTWLQLEQGCHQLFGKGIANIKKGELLNKNLFDVDILKYDWLPLISHDKSEFDNIKQYFVNYDIFTVFVAATSNFIDYAIRLKWPEKNYCLDLNRFNEFNRQLDFLEFDHCVTDWDPRVLDKHQEISNLAHLLNIDYNSNTANNYTSKYLQFHQ